MLKWLLALAAMFAACSAVAQDKPQPTEIGGIPWTPPPPRPMPKVIYGTDDRLDLYQETDPQRVNWAASTCALVSTALVTQNPDTTYTVTAMAYQHLGVPACPEEPYGDQPVIGFCTGFVVGPDLVATAGHCYSASNFANTTFIFGFVMTGPDTPVLTFTPDQVYRGVEVVARHRDDVYDYAIVRVDRTITAPGAVPLPLRRDGALDVGAHVGVIGHPSGLPMKLAFGNETVVRKNESPGFFVANLDTYGGNSGSPVFDPVTGLVEGILVRGATDYIGVGDCFVSYVVPDDGGRGEDVSKSVSFANYVPEFISGSGILKLNKAAFLCADSILIELTDIDLKGAGATPVAVAASGGDAEESVLTETGSGTGRFTGAILLGPGAIFPGNGAIEALESELITVTYQDASDDSGNPATTLATAPVDCTAATISGVTVTEIYGSLATIAFTSNETTTPMISYGLACGSWLAAQSGLPASTHTLHLSGLSPNTTYYFAVQTTDVPGNSAVDDNGGACYSFTTTRQQPYMTEVFTAGERPFDLDYTTLTFVPLENADGYSVCAHSAQVLPSDPAGGTLLSLTDDSFAEVSLAGGNPVILYGRTYDRIFVGSNGYLTFNFGDDTYTPLLRNHFAIPRVSPLFNDLNLSIRGSVSWKAFADRVAVTFDQVPEYDGTGAYPPSFSNTFQVELCFNGILRITYLSLSASDGIAGLSAGQQEPIDFVSNDFSASPRCSEVDTDGDELSDLDEFLYGNLDPLNPDMDGDGMPDGWELHRSLDPLNATGNNGPAADLDADGLTNLQEFQAGTLPGVADSDRDGVPDGQEISEGGDPVEAGRRHNADQNEDGFISLSELLRVVQFFNSNGVHCDASTEDGFAVGPGAQDCRPHDSDYVPQDWRVNLSELLRLVQFYNSGAYHRDLLGEDLYAVGPAH